MTLEADLGAAYDYGSGLVDQYGSAIKSGLEFLGKEGIDYLASTGSSIVNNYMTVLNAVEEYTKSVIGPVKSVLDSVTGLARQINDNLIEPIVNPIKQALAEYHTLKDEFHTDLKSGLSGLVKMPGQVADALTSVDAVLARSNEQLAEGQVAIATGVLAPGMQWSGAVPDAVRLYHETLSRARASVPDRDFPHVDIEGPQSVAGLRDMLQSAVDFVLHPGKMKREEVDQANSVIKIYRDEVDPKGQAFVGIMGAELEKAIADLTPALSWITRSVFEVFLAARGIDIMYEQQEALYRQDLTAATPTELLPIGDLIQAERRGIITQGERIAQGLKTGLDPSRQKVEWELSTWLIPPAVAIDWQARGYIDGATLASILSWSGISEEDQGRVISGSYRLPGPAETVAMLAREEVAQGEFLPDSLGTEPPASVQAIYAKNRIEQGQAALDWIAHWKIPPVGWWITSYFRGMHTYSDVQAAARAENIPPDIIDDLVGVEQETIQQWMLPDIIATGLVSESDFLAYADFIGLEPRSAKLLLEWGKSKIKAPLAKEYAEYAKVNQTTATTLYDAGTIDRATLLAIFRAHGYSADAAELAAEASDLKRQAKERIDDIERLAAEVDIGKRTALSAVDAAHAAGYTAREIETLEKLIQHKKLAKSKLPSESQLGKMQKGGLLTTAQYVGGLELIGYSPEWARLVAAAELGITLAELEAQL